MLLQKKDAGIMNSQSLGELASDQKIETVFHAYGYSIPVGCDGRRLWPKKFKRDLGERMRAGTLSVGEVKKTCHVSNSTAYKWKKKPNQPKRSTNRQLGPSIPAFAEVEVVQDESREPKQPLDQIVFKRSGCELILPSDYPVTSLLQLLRAFDSAP